MHLYDGGGMEIEIVERDSMNLFDSNWSVSSRKFEMEDIDIDINNINNIPMLPCLLKQHVRKVAILRINHVHIS